MNTASLFDNPQAIEPVSSPEAAEIILDLSRLLSRVLHPTPTGVDRVEMAYARALLRMIPDRLSFAAVHPTGFYGRLPTRVVGAFLDETEHQWSKTQNRSAAGHRIDALRRLIQLRPRRVPRPGVSRSRVYLQASPHHLDRPDLVAAILAQEKARFVCLVHDLIPMQFPEYARPDGAERHRKRMHTLGQYADAVIANSHATCDALQAYFSATNRTLPITVAHLGTDVGPGRHAAPTIDGPYFVCVGTIEPRKNHLLLLNVWRRMAEDKRADEAIPKLVLIGRRGWENENVLDMLDRCPHLQNHVIEASRMADDDVEGMISNACAVLLPSFAEGYGMPVAEALAMGVPVICSNLAALREVGGNVPEYLDPLDGTAWLATIRDYADPSSSARQAQKIRMPGAPITTWQQHATTVLETCDRESLAF